MALTAFIGWPREQPKDKEEETLELAASKIEALEKQLFAQKMINGRLKKKIERLQEAGNE